MPSSPFTTEWSAPPSPVGVTPLKIRKDSKSTMQSEDADRSPSTASKHVSPVSPQNANGDRMQSISLRPASTSTAAAASSRNTRRQSARSVKSHGFGKAPVDPHDFSGLQVDDRPEIEKDLPPLPPAYQQHMSRYIPEEKREHFAGYSPHPLAREGTLRSANSLPFSGTDGSSRNFDPTMKEAVVERPVIRTNVELKRNGRNHRRRAYILGVVVIVLILICVIVGAVVGTQRAHKNSDASTGGNGTSSLVTPTAAPSVINAGLPSQDLQVDTPLVPIQYIANTSYSGETPNTQYLQLWYQSKCVDVNYDLYSSGQWNMKGTQFTDAANVSGMAGIAYYNQSTKAFQPYIFYVATNGEIRDKKLNPYNNIFEVGPLINKQVYVSQPAASDLDNATMASDGFHIAAVYSQNFPQGPGARLFYHMSNSSGHYVQELIWLQADDAWSEGATLGGDVLPGSQLSMVVDEQNAVVRLMYASTSAAGIGLREYYMPLNPQAQGGGFWLRGQQFGGLLQHATSSFALAATGGEAYLYHVVPVNSSSPALMIQEVQLPAANGSASLASTADANQIVAIPDWLSSDTAGRVASVYTPIAAIGTPGNGQSNPATLTVWFADQVVDALAGYGALNSVQRQVGKSWGPASYAQAAGQVALPLESTCTAPEN